MVDVSQLDCDFVADVKLRLLPVQRAADGAALLAVLLLFLLLNGVARVLVITIGDKGFRKIDLKQLRRLKVAQQNKLRIVTYITLSP